MNVFILNTGRCGSTTIIKACQHITNYTAKHESRSSMLADERLNYPSNHIEADNRLTWFLGQLDQKYGNNAFYIHLQRERTGTVTSYARRWDSNVTIVRGFGESILIRRAHQLSDIEKLQISCDYYDAANANIALFLKDKTQKMEMHLETLETDFAIFWKKISAQGDFETALSDIKQKYNASEQPESHAAQRQAVTKRKGIIGKWNNFKLKLAYKIGVNVVNYYFKTYLK